MEFTMSKYGFGFFISELHMITYNMWINLQCHGTLISCWTPETHLTCSRWESFAYLLIFSIFYGFVFEHVQKEQETRIKMAQTKKIPKGKFWNYYKMWIEKKIRDECWF